MSNTVDLSPFKKDIDELLDEFSGQSGTSLEDMKQIWRSRYFSFIFDAKPSSNLAFFMSSLYAHVIYHIISGVSLSQRVGALYCLYCLHETQPFNPPFHIYVSLNYGISVEKVYCQGTPYCCGSIEPVGPMSWTVCGIFSIICAGEIKKLKDLVHDAKQNGVKEVPALVRRMLSRNMFLFGFVDKNDDGMSERLGELKKLHCAQLRVASDKLLSETHFEDHIHMDIAAALGLEELKKVSKEYAIAKKLAVDVAGKTVPTEDVRHIVEGDQLVWDGIEKIAGTWEAQKQQLYQQIGTGPPRKETENDGFDMELEALL